MPRESTTADPDAKPSNTALTEGEAILARLEASLAEINARAKRSLARAGATNPRDLLIACSAIERAVGLLTLAMSAIPAGERAVADSIWTARVAALESTKMLGERMDAITAETTEASK